MEQNQLDRVHGPHKLTTRFEAKGSNAEPKPKASGPEMNMIQKGSVASRVKSLETMKQEVRESSPVRLREPRSSDRSLPSKVSAPSSNSDAANIKYENDKARNSQGARYQSSTTSSTSKILSTPTSRESLAQRAEVTKTHSQSQSTLGSQVAAHHPPATAGPKTEQNRAKEISQGQRPERRASNDRLSQSGPRGAHQGRYEPHTRVDLPGERTMHDHSSRGDRNCPSPSPLLLSYIPNSTMQSHDSSMTEAPQPTKEYSSTKPIRISNDGHVMLMLAHPGDRYDIDSHAQNQGDSGHHDNFVKEGVTYQRRRERMTERSKQNPDSGIDKFAMQYPRTKQLQSGSYVGSALEKSRAPAPQLQIHGTGHPITRKQQHSSILEASPGDVRKKCQYGEYDLLHPPVALSAPNNPPDFTAGRDLLNHVLELNRRMESLITSHDETLELAIHSLQRSSSSLGEVRQLSNELNQTILSLQERGAASQHESKNTAPVSPGPGSMADLLRLVDTAIGDSGHVKG